MAKAKASSNGKKRKNVIIPNREIPHIKYNGVNFPTSPITAEYIGSKGIFLRADCLNLLTNIRDKTIDLAFADPPFNLGKTYNVPQFSDSFAAESYRGWCRSWLLELVRVLKPGGALFLYHWPMWLMDLGAWLNTLPVLEYKSWIAIKMKNGFPIKGRLHPAHYGILYYVKSNDKPTFNVVRTKSPTCRHCGELIRDYGGYRKKFERYEDENGIPWISLSDFWDDTRPARHDKTRESQVNELPIDIPERLIMMASNPGDVILDCFAGGASTLHAAHKNERLWIGGDIGEPLEALKRLATFSGTEEALRPTERVLMCFSKPFREGITRIDTTGNRRPVIEASRHVTRNGTQYNYESKSRVLGF